MHLPARRPWLPRVAATAAAIALAVGLTACGSDDSTGPAETSTTSSVTATTGAEEDDHGHGESGDAPTAQSLQANLEAIANPDIPVDEKVGMVADGEELHGQFEQFNAALQTYRGITFQVADITVDGDTATGQTTITSPRGQSAPPMPVVWQHRDDAWKLSTDGACILLGFAQIPCAPA